MFSLRGGSAQGPQPLKTHCPLLPVSPKPGLPAKPTCCSVGGLEIKKTEIARPVFKRSARLDSCIAADVGLVDTHEKTVDLGKTVLLSEVSYFSSQFPNCHNTNVGCNGHPDILGH